MVTITEQRRWEPEHPLSVAVAIEEAMASAPPTMVHSPRDLQLPEPHLPLRKASAKRRQENHASRGPPQFSPSHRGFRPSPAAPSPVVDSFQASSEHAFAGRDERTRKPFRPPLEVYGVRQPQSRGRRPERPISSATETDARQPPSPLLPPTPTVLPPIRDNNLRSTKSLGEGLRGLRHRLSSHAQGMNPDGRGPPGAQTVRPSIAAEEARLSFRSFMTSDSSLNNASSTLTTDCSSLATGNSSQSEFVQVYPDWPNTAEEERPSFSVDDVLGMYEDGFESVRGSVDTRSKRSFQELRLSSSTQRESRPAVVHRRSRSAGLLERFNTSSDKNLMPPKPATSYLQRSSADIIAGRLSSPVRGNELNNAALADVKVSRDRYGFKKTSHYINEQQYDVWNARYSIYLERRRKKWRALMKSYGLLQEKPIRFPPKSDKIKRYVRKGVPPEWRGAMWWWYAGGPGKLREHAGLYQSLVEQVEQGKLSENDRDLIERDLNRTFPDNIRFKPDPTTTLDMQAGAGGGENKKKKTQSVEPEMPVLCSLRRVLQTFAVHNPSIGYCQSLNFLAGLLLLFLDEDEEKAFLLLNIITTVHLPGTHGIALEGANIDIAVLMTCVKDNLPAIWAKLDDKGGGGGLAFSPAAQALRLPTVSLATTAWFMSLFVGTLPIEAVLRVWDCLFFEGSKTLFRIALAIFKFGERDILRVHDPMEIFQVVQTIPRSMLDVNGLMDVCFRQRRKGGFGFVSQELIERRREERRIAVKEGVVREEKRGLGRLRWRSRTKGP